jgi:hypothetical protein
LGDEAPALISKSPACRILGELQDAHVAEALDGFLRDHRKAARKRPAGSRWQAWKPISHSACAAEAELVAHSQRRGPTWSAGLRRKLASQSLRCDDRCPEW